MGPGVFTPGRGSIPPAVTRSIAGFNGAGRFHARKAPSRATTVSRVWAASMGPGVFTPGRSRRSTAPRAGQRASMGPGVFTPGRRAGERRVVEFVAASMGPGVFTPGRHSQLRGMLFNNELQWGRAFSRPEGLLPLAICW